MEFKQEFDHFSKKNYLSARKALRNQVQKAWLCPEGVKGINELDLHYYEKTLQATKQAILDDYEAEY